MDEYQVQTWRNDDENLPLSAGRMLHIEEGVSRALTPGKGDVRYVRSADPAVLSWRRRYAQRGVRPVRIVSLGDSWAAPVGASKPDRGWYSLTADALGGGSSGRHISPRAPHSVRLSGNASYDDNANPHMVTLAGDGRSAFFDLEGYSTIDVFYVRVGPSEAPEFGRPLVSVDGGALDDSAYTDDFQLYAEGTSYRFARIENFDGSSIELAPSGANGSIVAGIVGRRGPLNRGVEWINWAQSGWTAEQWMRVATDWTVTEPFKALPADLLHISLGANDYVQGLSVGSMLNELTNLVDLYREQVSECPVWFTLLPWPDLGYGDDRAAWDERMDAIRDLAARWGAMVTDLRVDMGTQSAISPELTPIDDYHLNDAGQQYMSDVAARALTS